MQTQNLAIAFFDVVGYRESTTRWTREEADRAIALHRDLMLPPLQAFGGQLVKISGGSYLVHFESPTNAALCATAVLDRCAAFQRSSPGETADFSVGMAMGEVRVEKKDVFGDAVNIAARLVGLAEPGEILLAEVVYLAMNKAEVPSEEVGERELKGIPEKVRVYRVPRGVYRISAVGEVPEGARDLPYGGLGLAHAPNLPPVDRLRPGSASGTFARLSRLRPIGGAVATAATGLVNRIFGNRVVALIGGVLLVAGIAGGLILLRTRTAAVLPPDPIELMIDRGEIDAAKAAIAPMPADGRRSYLEGRLVEGTTASRSVPKYVDAARLGEKRAANRLILLLSNPSCDAREHAARALGALHEVSAIPALRRVADLTDEGVRLGPFSFGCNPASAAREALRDLEPPSDGALH